MSSMTEHVGRVVGRRYRLLVPIGSGASSQVFAAVDTRLGRRVAVKVLHPALASDSSFLRRFRAEAQLAASLDHPHVMRVFDWGEEGQGPYLVLELLTGGSLRAVLDIGTPLTHAQVATLGSAAASGLAYAHRRGIIHRDIKPGNLLFDDEGHVRIADFGVARAIAQSALTEPIGMMLGTARYASPEQVRGSQLDDRTDVYSLALVLYEALTGRVPFSSDSVSETLMSRLEARLPPARELGPLAPILAAAAISEPLARLDAASLSAELGQLARQLPPPEPLSLARLSLGPGASAWEDRKAGDLDPGHPATTGRLAAGTSLDDAASALESEQFVADLTAMGVAATEGIPAGGAHLYPLEDTASRTPPRPWRRRWTVLSIVIVVLLVLAGAGFAVLRFGVYGHVVPDLRGQSLVSARAVAQDRGLRVRVRADRYDLGVPAGDVISQSIAPGTRERKGAVVSLVESRGPAPVPVPDLVGWGAKAARLALKAAHFVPVVKSTYSQSVQMGFVVTQNPPRNAGDQPRGSRVVISISLGPPPVTLPDVRNLPLQEAVSRLTADKLLWKQSKLEYSMTVPAGDVIVESPPPGTSLKQGSTVGLVVSNGQPFVSVPYVVGETVSAARSALASLGLSARVYGPGGLVVYQTPSRGSSVRRGTTITLATI